MPTTARLSPILLCALTATLLAPIARAEAATITYAQRFFLTTRDFLPDDPSAPDGLGASLRIDHLLTDFSPLLWTVPAFDPSLGTVESLTLELRGQASIKGRIPFGELFAYFNLVDPLRGELLGDAGAIKTCAGPCAFSAFSQLDWRETIAYSQGDPVLTWAIGQSADRFALFESAAWGDVKTATVGTVRAIYTYTPAAPSPDSAPAALHAPEPASLLLCASGLIALATCARRRRVLGPGTA